VKDVALRKPQGPNATEVALDQVQEVFDEYVTFPSDEARDAVVLWVLHTHVFASFESTPRLSIRSTEPGSGKTRVLEVMEHLVPKAMNAVYVTPGVMWRSMEQGHPTMMLDEADTIFGKSGSGSAHRYLRGIINAGHRKGATVPRCVGSEDVKQFHVFGPVVLAGIGRLPETIANRSVEIVMRRRRKGDREIRPFRVKFAIPELRKAYENCEEWAQSAGMELDMSMPELPVKDRDADVWEPLVSIADMASEQWGKRARKACAALTADSKEKPVSLGARLLKDIHAVFGDAEQLFTWEVLDGLYRLDDSPWEPGEFDSRKLSRMLVEYGIAPSVMRKGKEVARGYKRADFIETWERYVPEIVTQ
jgi:Protein of unknown function (DUF3631)